MSCLIEAPGCTGTETHEVWYDDDWYRVLCRSCLAWCLRNLRSQPFIPVRVVEYRPLAGGPWRQHPPSRGG